jgi:hypothetical protein
MNALIAEPSPITTPTLSTVSAVGANSTTPIRIDDFIKEKLKESKHAKSYGIIASAPALRKHGFTASASLRYASFLEAFRSAPDLVEYYAEHYPSCFFLPWKALHATVRSLKLWIDLPEHYTGAVPEAQLPWLDLFSMREEDAAGWSDITTLIPFESWDKSKQVFFESTIRQRPDFESGFVESTLDQDFRMAMMYSSRDAEKQYLERAKSHEGKKLEKAITEQTKKFQSSFFVVAPPEAFNSTEDFPTRFEKLVDKAHLRETTPPNDPLVIRFVRGGCLVVAAWGDEAAELNQMAKELNL